MKQTAVDWFWDKVDDVIPNSLKEKVELLYTKAKRIEKNQTADVQDVTRFEVIDHSGDKPGRVLTKYNIKVEMSLQDDNQTLKIFLTDGKTSDR